jgi:hypothetical protein
MIVRPPSTGFKLPSLVIKCMWHSPGKRVVSRLLLTSTRSPRQRLTALTGRPSSSAVTHSAPWILDSR